MVCHEQTLAEQGCSEYCDPLNLSINQTSTQFRAPRGDRDLLITPSLSSIAKKATENRLLFEQASFVSHFDSRTLSKRRTQTRREAIEIARSYTASLCPEAPPCTQCSIDEILNEKFLFVTGHQPELFHPGVWVKNVLIDELARRNQGVSLNIIIDSDAIKSNTVSVPVTQQKQFTKKNVKIDHWQAGLPWEELHVVDEELFASFADRVSSELPQQTDNASLCEFWHHVTTTTKESGNVVAGLVAGRVKLERKLGIKNLEVPLSLLAKSAGYQDFLAELILRADQLLETYNAAVDQYRKQYRIKSAMQPVPDLIIENGWTELPVWVWKQGSAVRRSLFIKKENGQLRLSDRFGWSDSISVDDCSQKMSDVSKHLQKLQQQGFRFRTKALMTTAFLRLFLSDWFVHGIGGAKYDEITNFIISKFWHFTAPQFHVATGTLHLPVKENVEVLNQTSGQLKQQLRYAEENPETLLDATQKKQTAELLMDKAALITQQKESRTEGLTRAQRKEKRVTNKKRHTEFQQIRSSLTIFVHKKLQQLRTKIEETEIIEKNLLVATNREYPICFFSSESLRDFAEKIRQPHENQANK